VAQMRANLTWSGGVIMAEALAMALATQLGRPAAQRLVQSACMQAMASGHTLRQVALEDVTIRGVLSPEEIARALDPAGYTGSADVLIDLALASYHAIMPEQP